MKIDEIVGKPYLLSEGYKLSKTEIDHLFQVIADGRYGKWERKIDKVSKFAKGIKSDIKDSINQEGDIIEEGPIKDLLSGAKSKLKSGARELAGIKPDVTKEQLIQIWRDKYNSTTDSDEIIMMLKKELNMSSKNINMAFRKAADDQPLIRQLADKIKAKGDVMVQHILRYLEDGNLYKNKVKDPRPTRYGYNSRNNRNKQVPESINEAQQINQKQIRDLFTKVARELPQKQAQGNEEIYFDEWSQNFKSATDPNTKAKLITDVVSKLSSIKDTEQWNKTAPMVQNMIKSDNIVDKNLSNAAIVKIQKGEVLSESINLEEKIREIKQLNMYGRRLK